MAYRARINSIASQSDGNARLDVIFETNASGSWEEIPSGHVTIELSSTEILTIVDDSFRVTQVDGEGNPLEVLTDPQKVQALATLMENKSLDVGAYVSKRAVDLVEALIVFPTNVSL